MDAWPFGLLEVAPVAIVAVIVFRHFRGARRAEAVQETGPQTRPGAQGTQRRD